MLLNCGVGRRLLRVPWTARISKQSILKKINPEYSLEGLMLKLKLKLQYFGHLMWRANSLEKILMLGKTEVKRRRGWKRTRLLDGITDISGCQFDQALGDGDGPGSLVSCSPWGHGVKHDWVTKQQPSTQLLRERNLELPLICSPYTLLVCHLNILKIHLNLFTPFNFPESGYHHISPLTQMSPSLSHSGSFSPSHCFSPILPHSSLILSSSRVIIIRKKLKYAISLPKDMIKLINLP